jgi:fatty-acyl-CoA synthase
MSIDADGWMHSGDLATIDAEGYGNIVGRLKDMVIRGGENIYPREIEELSLPPSRGRGRAVVGIPDERMGEELCAWMRLRGDATGDEDEIRDLLPRPHRPLQDPAPYPFR